MVSVKRNILGETAGDTITIVFDVSKNGTFFPVTSTWMFTMKKDSFEYSVAGTAVNDAGSTTVTITVPSSKTSQVGQYNYALTETNVGGSLSTVVRGILTIETKV